MTGVSLATGIAWNCCVERCPPYSRARSRSPFASTCSTITPAWFWLNVLRVSYCNAAGSTPRGLFAYSARVSPSGSCAIGRSTLLTTSVTVVPPPGRNTSFALPMSRRAALCSRGPSVSKWLPEIE